MQKTFYALFISIGVLGVLIVVLWRSQKAPKTISLPGSPTSSSNAVVSSNLATLDMTTSGPTTSGYVFLNDAPKPNEITQLKHPAEVQRLQERAAEMRTQIHRNLEGKYSQIREWNKRYFLNVTNQDQNVVLLCSFYSASGDLKQVSGLWGVSQKFLVTFYTNGNVKLFEDSTRNEGIQFFDDGKAAYFYTRLSDGKEYSVTWNQNAKIASEMIR